MLYESARKAISRFAQIARTLDAPPESFLVHSIMLDIHEQHPDWCIRPEFPSRECADWGIPTDDPQSPLLGNFRIDLACFYSPERKATDAALLIEFKLWTNQHDVARDLARLKALTNAIANAERDRPLEAYVVCCPHYATLEKVDSAIKYFRTVFKFHERPAFPTSEEIATGSAGVVVINALDHGAEQASS
ncbi:hypothetical protein [Rhodopseudomonas sp. AAP120]|uniref:hypothetical protein n=1 Tax=Rhodopseudomonas sp. AAP120 TaxID=1523430 RepID=UPI0012E1ECA4|nr:hypothetical protein [Rhodopseudomonas sp. AAP120]